MPGILKHSNRNKLKVIDLRAHPENIGYMRQGVRRKPVAIVTKQPLAAILETHYSKYYSPENNSPIELLMVLHDMAIEDRPNGDEIGTLHFEADFYHGENGRYRFMGNVDSIYEAISSFDVSDIVLDLTDQKINTLLLNFASAPAPQGAWATEADARAKKNTDKMAYPIYQAQGFKRGIYRTADDFLQHRPADTSFIAVKARRIDAPATMFFYTIKPDGKRGKEIERDSYFAIYSGEAWYVPGKMFAEEMDHKDNEFLAPRNFKGMRSYQKDMVASAMVFGAVGAGIVAASESVRTVNGTYMCRFDPVRKAFMPYIRLL